jgi:hypothetical protein
MNYVFHVNIPTQFSTESMPEEEANKWYVKLMVKFLRCRKEVVRTVFSIRKEWDKLLDKYAGI